MSKYDILQAAPVPAGKTGLQRFYTRDSKISGPQKALQALSIALLSDNFPTDTGIMFMKNIESGKFRDRSGLMADFSIYKSNIIEYLADSSRPASETIEDLNITDVIVSEDKLSITFSVTFASGTTLSYEMPIPL